MTPPSPDLIEALEAATEGSRELDIEIEKFLAGPDCLPGDNWWEEVENYTTSLDAALTLVPPDPATILGNPPMLWSISYDEDGVAGPRSFTASLGKGYHDPEYIYGHHPNSPALALCIAALRARQGGG